MTDRELLYIVASEEVIADARSRRLSPIHITHFLGFEGASSARIPELHVTAVWSVPRTKDSFSEEWSTDVTLHVSPPGNHPGFKFDRQIMLGDSIHVAMFRVTNIPVKESGELLFEVELDGKINARFPVVIEFLESS